MNHFFYKSCRYLFIEVFYMHVYDGHIHSPFCPHGSNDPFEKYIEEAIALHLRGITFTEHAPLPESFVDPTPLQDSAMAKADLPLYLTQLQTLKEKYEGKIQINIGLEVDYIEGYEKETSHFLNEYGPFLDDCILSVHFLKINDTYHCIDYSPDAFSRIISEVGTVDKVYELYFNTVLTSIHADLGIYKPNRIGHISLVHKFQKMFQPAFSHRKQMLLVLDAIKQANMSLDINSAGLGKPLCQEQYPPHDIVEEAIKRQIPLVYGSDAHQAKALAQAPMLSYPFESLA